MQNDNMATAVAATLDALNEHAAPADAATHQLAARYARELDNAEWIGRGAEKIIRMVEEDPDTDIDLLQAVQALRNKLSARQTLADLGPKLTALLVELGATPKARAAMTKAAGGGPSVPSNSKLTALRAGRAV